MSRKIAVAGLGIVLLVVGAALAYERDAEVVTVVILGLVAGVAALAALDANQRVREQQRYLERWKKSSGQRLRVVEDELLRRGAQVKAVTQDDVLGTVKLLQEQYVGRLDHAQAELEQAVAALRATARDTRPE